MHGIKQLGIGLRLLGEQGFEYGEGHEGLRGWGDGEGWGPFIFDVLVKPLGE